MRVFIFHTHLILLWSQTGEMRETALDSKMKELGELGEQPSDWEAVRQVSEAFKCWWKLNYENKLSALLRAR